MAFTWLILNSITNAPIAGAGVVMNNLETGQQWLAQSGADGRAVVIPLVSPPVTHDEQYDSYVVKNGFIPYSLMNTNWGPGGTWTAYLTPQSGEMTEIHVTQEGEGTLNVNSVINSSPTTTVTVAHYPPWTSYCVATPAKGYKFSKWVLDGVDEKNNPLGFQVTGIHNLKGVFVKELPIIPIAIGGIILAYIVLGR